MSRTGAKIMSSSTSISTRTLRTRTPKLLCNLFVFHLACHLASMPYIPIILQCCSGGGGGAPLYLVEHMRKQGVFKEGIILENINFVDPIIMYFLTIFFKTLWVG